VWHIDLAFFGGKFEDGRMSDFVGNTAVEKFEEHGVGDMKAGELIESGRREEDFAAMVCGWTLGAGHHYDRIAAVVFIEAARRWVDAAGAHAGGEHGVRVVVVESLAERKGLLGSRWRTGYMKAYHGDCSW